MSEAILAENLQFSYSQGEGARISVFDGLNFQIAEGSFVAVLGRNGCGKSTLAKHFNAILLPEGGSVQVFGMDTRDENLLLDIRRTVGMVFQNPDNQLIAAVVEDDVAFGPENLGMPPDEIRTAVREALACVNMTHYRKFAPHLLSGGQKQRVAIAGALAMKTRCLVLDEPTAMLDPQGRAEVMETVCRLHEQQGITIVLITHFMEEAALADRVIVMANGRVADDGTPREIFRKAAALKAFGLDVPLATELGLELRASGLDVPQDILTDDELTSALVTLADYPHGLTAATREGRG